MLASIAHAFYSHVTVLRDGAKPALQTDRSRKAECGFLDVVSLPWGQQVAVMFQILCGLVLDISVDVFLAFKPWGHVDHTGLRVVDLDTSIVPDVFGLHAFDQR